jgi:hypothetical protein
MRVVEIEKEDLLNREVKAYENNIKVLGMKYDIKEAQKQEEKGKRRGERWCYKRSW